jgi:flagellar hook assembly protein FlgD
MGAGRPNPFTGSVAVSYSLPSRADVAIRIYDVAGRLVRSLVKDNEPAGMHDVVWDGRDDAGQRVSRGAYFWRMEAGSWTREQKVILLSR